MGSQSAWLGPSWRHWIQQLFKMHQFDEQRRPFAEAGATTRGSSITPLDRTPMGCKWPYPHLHRQSQPHLPAVHSAEDTNEALARQVSTLKSVTEDSSLYLQCVLSVCKT